MALDGAEQVVRCIIRLLLQMALLLLLLLLGPSRLLQVEMIALQQVVLLDPPSLLVALLLLLLGACRLLQVFVVPVRLLLGVLACPSRLLLLNPYSSLVGCGTCRRLRLDRRCPLPLLLLGGSSPLHILLPLLLLRNLQSRVGEAA